jgi:hypothetical protein
MVFAQTVAKLRQILSLHHPSRQPDESYGTWNEQAEPSNEDRSSIAQAITRGNCYHKSFHCACDHLSYRNFVIVRNSRRAVSMPKVAASCPEPSPDCQARHSTREDRYEAFSNQPQCQSLHQCCGHEIRFGKPKDASFDGLFLMGQRCTSLRDQRPLGLLR